MLVIREAQMEALRQARRRSFENVAVARWMLRRARAAEAESSEVVRSSVREGIKKALQHGFDKENHILRFLDLMCELGIDFDRSSSYPWASQILGDKELASGLKIALLRERVKESRA